VIAMAVALIAASTASPSVCRDGETADSAVSAVYELVSVPAGGTWDWDRIGGLFVDQGVFVTMMPGASNAPMIKADLSTLRTQTQEVYGRSGFIEREYKRETRIFGDIASIYSSFQIAVPANEGRPLARGLHHFQLVRSRGCWRIVSNISQIEGSGWQLPAAFATKRSGR